MANRDLGFARITSGVLYEFLKDIDIYGRFDEKEEFVVFGCKNEDQDRFYKAIFEMDKADPIQEFDTVEEVKEWWEDGCDMLFYVEKGCFERVKECEPNVK